jgi:DNA polymerase-3 subunit delta
MRDLCFNSYYADEADTSEICSVAQTFPFLAERRVVLVNGAEHYDDVESAARPLLAYLERPCDLTLLILVAAQVDRRMKFFRSCEKNAVIVECPELRRHEAVRWAVNEARQRGKTVDSAAAERLVERAGTRLGDVANAVTLVCNYVGDAPAVHVADIEAACADVAEEEIWALTDAIAVSDTNKAVHVLRRLIELGRNESEVEFKVLGTLNWLLKTAYMAAIPQSGRVKPFLANKVRPLADKLGREKFRDAFALLMDTDILFRSTGVDRGLALELLVIKLAAPRKSARG